jgi:hypothetical protein
MQTEVPDMSPAQNSAKDEIYNAIRSGDIEGANALFWQAADRLTEDECVEIMQAVSLALYS